MKGLEVCARFENLNCSNEIVTSDCHFKEFIIKAIEEVCLTPLNYSGYNFLEGGLGFSSCVILAESHVAIHTWPEFNSLTLNIFVCNYNTDNTEKCINLFNKFVELYKPGFIRKEHIPL